jgi:hypothetical protein
MKEKIVCNSCYKEVTGEVKIVSSNKRGWGAVRKAEQYFHATPLDCANAVEPAIIITNRMRALQNG